MNVVASALLIASRRFLLALGYSSWAPSMAVANGSVTCIVMKDLGMAIEESWKTRNKRRDGKSWKI